MSCYLCSGVCTGVDLAPLVAPDLVWLWEVVAKMADRRGDEHMTSGTVTVIAPGDAAQRAAVAGLLDRRPLRAGQGVRVNLAELALELSVVGPGLTPGAVAAHAVGRRLAAKSKEREARDAATAEIVSRLREQLAAGPAHLALEPHKVIEHLARIGWVARIRSQPDPRALIDAAAAVLARLPEPGARVDRRTLVPGDPHALDSGVLPSLVLAMTGFSGMRARQGWNQLGVDFDDLLGGLTVTGVHPAGWTLPNGAVVTLPPRELASISWDGPASSAEWAFVTENPSVLTAAVQGFRDGSAEVLPKVICTAGTPSQLECAAIGALSTVGWQVAVRADFDLKGLEHMRAMLTAAPSAVPWRMSAQDYLAVAMPDNASDWVSPDASPWDPSLAEVMNNAGVPAFEEDLLDLLVRDVLHRGFATPAESDDSDSDRITVRAPAGCSILHGR